MSNVLNQTNVEAATDGKHLPHLHAGQWRTIAVSLQLTDREFDVAAAVLEGKSEAAIATKLGLSSRTVHCHLDHIYRKLGINSRCDLVLRIFAEYLNGNPAASYV